MSTRKRRRKSRPPVKRRPREVVAAEYEREEEEESGERYRPDSMSEDFVPKEAPAGRHFRAAGMVCNTCGWRTRKSGLVTPSGLWSWCAWLKISTSPPS